MIAWFRREGRDYPWRRTDDPYAIVVSEFMLQQTRIATVLGKRYFERFLERFPDIATLASADDDAILKAWEGLGYYRRVRQLRETARTLVRDHGGVFPSDPAALLALPGIGPYTAGAIRSFARNEPAALVDGNIIRVLARILDLETDVSLPATQKLIWDAAAVLVDPRHPREFNSAVMELGQRWCSPGLPDCAACPVARFCRTRVPANLPLKKPRLPPTRIIEHVVWSDSKTCGLLMARNPPSARRAGMWSLPSRDPQDCADFPEITRASHSVTRYRVEVIVHRAPENLRPATHESRLTAAELAAAPVAAPYRRFIRTLREDA